MTVSPLITKHLFSLPVQNLKKIVNKFFTQFKTRKHNCLEYCEDDLHKMIPYTI